LLLKDVEVCIVVTERRWSFYSCNWKTLKFL